ncbi:hypothetical protein [Paenibacillus sabinae]|uniref:hypothetical protein n=1 Tax=Paenibacillus sabinae TaxID=365617 RepID=UPI000AFBA726|nr:hypothetical protein [Paenibacillus sabinae]
MILHPDGRVEGTPEEIVAYKRIISTQNAPNVVSSSVDNMPRYATQSPTNAK